MKLIRGIAGKPSAGGAALAFIEVPDGFIGVAQTTIPSAAISIYYYPKSNWEITPPADNKIIKLD